MIWLVLFLAIFSLIVCLEGLFTMAFPFHVRRCLVWLADMRPGQLRFIGLAVCCAGLLIMFSALLIVMFADWGDNGG